MHKTAEPKRLVVKLDDELHARFTGKAITEYGSYSRLIKKFVSAYTEETFFADDRSVGSLYRAVNSLYSFTNNLNQMTKKLHSKGELDPRFTPEYLAGIRGEIKDVVEAFREVVETDTRKMNKLMERYEIDD